jgi:hypothetical protein
MKPKRKGQHIPLILRPLTWGWTQDGTSSRVNDMIVIGGCCFTVFGIILIGTVIFALTSESPSATERSNVGFKFIMLLCFWIYGLYLLYGGLVFSRIRYRGTRKHDESLTQDEEIE